MLSRIQDQRWKQSQMLSRIQDQRWKQSQMLSRIQDQRWKQSRMLSRIQDQRWKQSRMLSKMEQRQHDMAVKWRTVQNLTATKIRRAAEMGSHLVWAGVGAKNAIAPDPISGPLLLARSTHQVLTSARDRAQAAVNIGVTATNKFTKPSTRTYQLWEMRARRSSLYLAKPDLLNARWKYKRPVIMETRKVGELRVTRPSRVHAATKGAGRILSGVGALRDLKLWNDKRLLYRKHYDFQFRTPYGRTTGKQSITLTPTQRTIRTNTTTRITR